MSLPHYLNISYYTIYQIIKYSDIGGQNMKYLVVVFSSRNDTMQFYNTLKSYNTYCSIINTPRILSRSCGISVKIVGGNLELAKRIISARKFATFKGIFELSSKPNVTTPPIKLY